MVGDSRTSTRWIVIGGALAVVLVISLAMLVVVLRGPSDTTQVLDTTTTTTSTTAAPRSTTTLPETDAPTTEPEDIVVTDDELDVGGRSRSFLTIAPRTPPPADGYPVVMVLHGLGVNASAMSRAAPWREAVARDEFVAVFPRGVQDSWNLGPCCLPASLLGVRDMDFLDTLLDDLERRSDVDAERIFLTGFSNGALMVYELACARSQTFAAVAPLAGANLTGCSPSQPLSLLHQHSDADLVVPFRGGVALGSILIIDSFPSVTDGVAAWAADDGCDPTPVVEPGVDVERTTWTGCRDGTRVELIRIPAVGHVWPRRGSFDPLEELLDFFELS